MLRLLISIIIGLVIGRERKKQNQIGGSRTMAIVSMASCLMAILSLELFSLGYSFDFVRILSYGIASIGFLGSAIVIKSGTKIEGVTSASTIWLLVPINFCIGLGFYFYGIFASICAYLLLESKYWKDDTNDRN
jgi:putative Mg2+ transporter-C (MgtC) family protein